jgi:hypothetical protein
MGTQSNGVQDGIDNVKRFVEWCSEVTDFKAYVYQGTLSVSRVAREAGLNRDVFYTNPEIRDNLWPALIRQLEQQGVLMSRVANPVELIRREPRRSAASEARVKQIQEENEALKAENIEFRKRLEKFEGMDEILRTTGRLPW